MVPVLDPQGAIGLAERALMIHAMEFMLIVAVPVYFLLFFFAYKYRASSKKKSTYNPNWEHGKLEEFVWWIIPLEIILVLGAMTWTSTHELDPRKALAGGDPLVVQVVALDWKWLFIYKEEGIATVNYLKMPVGKPVRFELTADAPMNSFWIPALGGQIYAMTGMTTALNLVADSPGTYRGASANYSGDGFAKMKFAAHAVPEADFHEWVAATKAQAAGSELTFAVYQGLAKPSVIDIPPSFGRVESGLFERVVAQFKDSGMPVGAH